MYTYLHMLHVCHSRNIAGNDFWLSYFITCLGCTISEKVGKVLDLNEFWISEVRFPAETVKFLFATTFSPAPDPAQFRARMSSSRSTKLTPHFHRGPKLKMPRTLSSLIHIHGDAQRQLVIASVYFFIASSSVAVLFWTLFTHLNVPAIQSAWGHMVMSCFVQMKMRRQGACCQQTAHPFRGILPCTKLGYRGWP
jgi:hypothetical protein